MKKVVCLISGGMDSFVTSAIAKKKGYEIFALTVRYGQKNIKEVSCAKRIAKYLKAKKHNLLDIDLSWTNSALTNTKIKIPENKPTKRIPSTYVPARNTILISVGIALAETINAKSIFIGVNSVDFSGYPDCRPEYIKRFQALLNIATKKTLNGEVITLETPIINMSKSEIIKEGLSLGLDFTITHSCYNNFNKPCGKCPSCILRQKGFKEAGIEDPLLKG